MGFQLPAIFGCLQVASLFAYTVGFFLVATLASVIGWLDFVQFSILLFGAALTAISVVNGSIRLDRPVVFLTALIVAAFAIQLAAFDRWDDITLYKIAVVLAAHLAVINYFALWRESPRISRLLTYGLSGVEVIIIGQIAASFLFLVGEVHIFRTGQIRAQGWIGDTAALVLVFFVIYHTLTERFVRAFVAWLALLMMGGKAALGLAVLSVPIAATASARPARVLIGRILAAATAVILFTNVVSRLPDLIDGDRIPPKEIPQISPVEGIGTSTWSRLSPDQQLFLQFVRNTGVLRLASIGAGYVLFVDHPLTGAGYGLTADRVQEAARVDVFGLQECCGITPTHFEFINGIHNHVVRLAAEMGLPGIAIAVALAAFVVVRASRLYVKRRRHACAAAGDGLDDMATAGAIWAILFVLFHQTGAWLLPGNIQFHWLTLMMGIISMWLPETRRCPRPVAPSSGDAAVVGCVHK